MAENPGIDHIEQGIESILEGRAAAFVPGRVCDWIGSAPADPDCHWHFPTIWHCSAQIFDPAEAPPAANISGLRRDDTRQSSEERQRLS